MHLKTLFPAIVGNLLVGAAGLTGCTTTGYDYRESRGPYCQNERASSRAQLIEPNSEFDVAFTKALDVARGENPGASSAELLERVFRGRGQLITEQSDNTVYQMLGANLPVPVLRAR